jgi:hypothetical protein
MAPVTARNFRGPRLELGLAFSDGERTLYEAAKALGRSSGSIQGLVRRMVADGLLAADSDPPTRGTLYEIHPDARDALLEAAEGLQAPGSLAEHQRLLSVWGGSRLEAVRILASTTLSGAVGWVARTNSADELLVAMNPEASDLQIDKLVAAFEAAGFKYREGLVASIMSARDLRRHNETITTSVEGAA